jgi:hypothetical protein
MKARGNILTSTTHTNPSAIPRGKYIAENTNDRSG